MKKLFGDGGIKAFLIEHVEKILLGIVAVFALFIVSKGFSAREGIGSDYDPAKLDSKVASVKNKIESYDWSDFSSERVTNENLSQRAESSLQALNTASYQMLQLPYPPYQRPRRLRSDPDLYPVENLQARSGFAVIHQESARDGSRDGRASDDPFGNAAPQPPRGGERGGSGEELAENERPLPSSASGERGARSRGGKAEGKFFVVVTGLIPYRKQLQQYKKCLADSSSYDSSRDVPNYANFKLERAEYVPGREDLQWKRIGTWDTTAKILKRWGGGGSTEASRQRDDDVVAAKYTDRILTMPILPFELDKKDTDRLMRHASIDPVKDDKQQGNSERGPRRPEAPEPSTDESATDSDVDMFSSAGGSRDRNPRDRERAPRDGQPPSDRDRGRARERDRDRGGSGGRQQRSVSLRNAPEFVMFRFVDVNVEPNKQYKYRVQLWLEDPNDPDLRSQTAPAPSTLERAVKERISQKTLDPAVKARGLKNNYYRISDYSQPSDPVLVSNGGRLLVKNVTAPKRRPGGYPTPGDEPQAEVLALEFDAEQATDIPCTMKAYRGTVGNLTTDVEVPIWSENVLRKEENYQLRTDCGVLDFTGGEDLDFADLTGLGAMLVWRPDGITVVTEADSAATVEKFDFPPEDERPGGRDSDFGGRRPGEQGPEGDRESGRRRRGGRGRGRE